MPFLYLHIGHAKTGSTWIQSTLRINRELLKDRFDILYPKGNDHFQGANAISSGNARGLFESKDTYRQKLLDYSANFSGAVFLSSEFLFLELASLPDLSFVADIAREVGFDGVKMLLFIRDPLGQAASGWQQIIKRGGSDRPVEQAFFECDQPLHVDRLLRNVPDAPGLKLTVRNYSRCSHRLIEEVETWLGLSEGCLVRPEVRRVNRSMSMAELELLRALNAHIGVDTGRLLADPLCEWLPDVEPDDVRPPLEIQKQTWERLLPFVESVNARVEPAHRYQCDIKKYDSDMNDLSLSAEQLRLIGDTLGREIAELRTALDRAKDASAPEITRAKGPMRAGASALFRRLAAWLSSASRTG